jgi:hypothetical protein
MELSLHLRTRARMFRAAAVLCVFLIFLTGFIAAVHFHAAGPGTSDRACSVCALAHSGVVPVISGQQSPILVPSVISEAAPASSHSLLLVSSQFIRPPPAV